MEGNRFEKWLRNIFATRDEEISCSECFDRISQFVDEELSGTDPVKKMPGIKEHLDQCAACREEYETLRDLARLENEGGLPPMDELKGLMH